MVEIIMARVSQSLDYQLLNSPDSYLPDPSLLQQQARNETPILGVSFSRIIFHANPYHLLPRRLLFLCRS
jgi:hypothetical protein